MTKYGRIDDNPCDVLVVNQGPPSNPCVLVVFFHGFLFFGGSDLASMLPAMVARRGERRELIGAGGCFLRWR